MGRSPQALARGGHSGNDGRGHAPASPPRIPQQGWGKTGSRAARPPEDPKKRCSRSRPTCGATGVGPPIRILVPPSSDASQRKSELNRVFSPASGDPVGPADGTNGIRHASRRSRNSQLELGPCQFRRDGGRLRRGWRAGITSRCGPAGLGCQSACARRRAGRAHHRPHAGAHACPIARFRRDRRLFLARVTLSSDLVARTCGIVRNGRVRYALPRYRTPRLVHGRSLPMGSYSFLRMVSEFRACIANLVFHGPLSPVS